MLPKITIVIPIYNVEGYIVACLQSVTRQTYDGEIECIIVDDCGQDDCVAIVERFIADYTGKIHFIFLHHNFNRGLSAARNTGMSEASGEYIFFLDGDDYISDDCIKLLSAPLEEKRYDMVMGNIKVIPTNQRFLWVDMDQSIESNSILFELFSNVTLYVMAFNKLVSVDFLRDNNISFLEGQMHEDDLWTYKISKVIQSVYVTTQYTYMYVMRDDSIMHDEKKIAKRVESLYILIMYILSNPYENTRLYLGSCLYYLKRFINLAFLYGIDIRKEYSEIRRHFGYNPLSAFFQGKGTLMDVKHLFHLVLPVNIGYKYLQIRHRWNTHNR